MLPTTPTDLPFDPAAALLRPSLPLSGMAPMPEAEPGEAFAGLLEASQARLTPSPGIANRISSQPLLEPVSQPMGEAAESVPAPMPAKAVAERAPAPVAVMPLPGTRLPPSGEMLPSLLPPSIKAPQPAPAETVSLPSAETAGADKEGSPDLTSPEAMVAVAIAAPAREMPEAGIPMPANTTSDRPLASVARAIPVAVPATAPLASLADSDSAAVVVLQPQFFARQVPPPQAAKPNHVPAANPLPPDDGVMTASLRVLPPNHGASAVRRSAKAEGAAAPLTAAAMPAPSTTSPPAPAPLPGAAAPASAPAPSPAMVPEAGAAQGASLATQPAGIEAAIEQLAGLRDAARAARPEMTLRHGEFGAVSLRVEASAAVPGEWRAVVASRDPGFVPAVQAALAERAIAAAGEAASSGGLSSGANGSGSGPGQGTYGSSPGSQQGSSQPYSPQGQGERRHAAAKLPDQPAAAARRADDPAGGLFA